MIEGPEGLVQTAACFDRILAALDACPPVEDPALRAVAVEIRQAALDGIEAVMARRAELEAAALIICRAVLPVLAGEQVAPVAGSVDA